ncbi:unnamed protein product, partial [marine sediment metagenome]
LAGFTGTSFNIIGSGWSKYFSGVFDGSGHTISNFTYTSTEGDKVGLFGYVGKWRVVDAEIKDLGLINPNVDAGSGDKVGSLVGWLGDGTITNCYVEAGSVSGNEAVGGLVGFNFGGTINNCYSSCDVSGTGWNVGGLE